MSKQSLITTFCVKGLVPTRQPLTSTKKRRAEPLPKRGPGRPRKRPCLRAEPAVYPHDLSDAVKVVDDYHAKLEKHFSHLYLDKFESELLVEHRVRKPRATYSNEVRFEVLEYLGTGESVRATARAFGIPKSTVADIKKVGYPGNKSREKGRHNSAGSGRPLNYPTSVDEELLVWILKMRDLQMPISRADIQIKGKELISPHCPNFAASEGWLQRFMRRNKLVLRAKTSLAQRLPAQLEEKITQFYTKLQQVQQHESYPFCFIGNMDETPVYFDLVSNKVVDRKGAKDCRVITTGAEKRHVTVVLTVMADGQMPPPMIIFKGKRALKLTNVPDGMVVTVQDKAWMDHELMNVYLNKIWHPFIKRRAEELGLPTKSLLVMDSFSAHLTTDVSENLKNNNTQSVIVPGGCTSKVQPLDVSINKPFKQILKKTLCQEQGRCTNLLNCNFEDQNSNSIKGRASRLGNHSMENTITAN